MKKSRDPLQQAKIKQRQQFRLWFIHIFSSTTSSSSDFWRKHRISTTTNPNKATLHSESKWVIIAQQEIQQQKYKSGRTQCKTETKENIAIACCCRRSCGRKRFVCQHIFYAWDDDEFEVGDVADDNDDNLTPDMKQKESDACGKYYVN